MAKIRLPIPHHVFVVPSMVDWTNPADYPSLTDTDPQRLSWEFLRRNARYVEGYRKLDRVKKSCLEYSDQADFANAHEHFCLMWQIKKPIDPDTSWADMPLEDRERLVGAPRPNVILPALTRLAEVKDTEVGKPKLVSTFALQTQAVFRLSINGDAVEQGRHVTATLRALQKRDTFKEQLRNAEGQEAWVYRSASLFDYDADRRYVRLDLSSGDDKILKNNREVKGPIRLSLPTTPFRITGKPMHFILRTLDAISVARTVTRDDIASINVEPAGTAVPEDATWPRGQPADNDDSDPTLANRFQKQSADYAKSSRLIELGAPFGERARKWTDPLSSEIAKRFRENLMQTNLRVNANIDPDLEVIPQQIGRKKVLAWMRLARYFVLEQGYLHIAASKPLRAKKRSNS